MLKQLLRIIAVFLVPCLVADPSLAFLRVPEHSPVARPCITLSAFETQAFMLMLTQIVPSIRPAIAKRQKQREITLIRHHNFLAGGVSFLGSTGIHISLEWAISIALLCGAAVSAWAVARRWNKLSSHSSPLPKSFLRELGHIQNVLQIPQDKINDLLAAFQSGKRKLSGEKVDVIQRSAEGKETIVGPLDLAAVEYLKLLCRAVVMLVLTHDGRMVLQVRPPHKSSQQMRLASPAGRVRTQEDYVDAMRRELKEEFNLSSLQGHFIWHSEPGEYAGPHDNNLRITLAIYVMSKEETPQAVAQAEFLELTKSEKTPEDYAAWLKTNQDNHSHLGDAWSIIFLSIAEAENIAKGTISKSFLDRFKNSLVEIPAHFTDGSLHWLTQADVIAALRAAALRRSA